MLRGFILFDTLNDFLIYAEENLNHFGSHFGHGTNNAWDEACALATFVLGLPHDADQNLLSRKITDFEAEKLCNYLKVRIENSIPMPYLTHTAWFGGLPFFVDRRVLIPRSPLAEPILQELSPWLNKSPKRILDLCTGSGCIAILLAKVFNSAIVDAIDIEKEALSVAKMNVVRHQVEDRVHLIKSDLFTEVKNVKYDVIISNPPYVSTEEMQNLPREYRYEPRLALEAGNQGLSIVERILEEALLHLEPYGMLIVELGNAADILVKTHSSLPFIWLEFEQGGEGVFLLMKGEESWLPVS